MTIGRSARMFLGAIAVLLAMAASAAAQTNDEFFENFQWSFSTPGARSNAMGRAFIGMADDATATISNPSGLVNLTRPQVYAEYKNTDLKVNRLAATDSLTTLQTEEFSKDINALSFFAVSMPLGQSKRVAVGFTIHQFLNYQEQFNLNARTIPNSPGGFVLFPVDGDVNFKGTTFGFSASAALTPKFDVGVTLGINKLDASSTATRDNDLFNPPRDSGIVANQTSINGSNTAAGVSFGALYKPSDKISVGFVGVVSPKFKVKENELVNPGFCSQTPCPVAGTNPPGVNQPLVPGGSRFPANVDIDVPNRFGVGIGLRPNSRWVFAFDAVRINYSSLTQNVTLIFDSGVLNGTEYKTNNVTETHFGAEYNVATGNMPVFLRAGFFTSPAHTPTFTGVNNPTASASDIAETNAAEKAIYNSLSPKADNRGTIGAGFVFGQRTQLDIAYVFGKEIVASTAFRF